MEKNVYIFFMRKKIETLINIKDGITQRKLGKITDNGDSGTRFCVKFLINSGLVTSIKENRTKVLYLTLKGKIIKNKFINMIKLLDGK